MATQAAVKARTAQQHVTRDLVELTQGYESAALPADVKELARRCVLDWIAVTVAGSCDPVANLVLEHALEEGGRPAVTVVGRHARVAPLQGALVNGTASHVLDYDDVNLSMNGHPSAAVLPALLALAEARAASGAELVAAFVAGYETACRVGLLVAPGHYLRGFHATATVGSVAAAAACSRLLRLDSESAAMALGIAATQAAGLKAMFGTHCKPFHAGLAAQNGLRAAQLAARGMVSRTDALECRQGFALTLSPDFNPDAALGDPAKFFLRENLFKYHASCYGTHSALECVRRLRDAHGVQAQNVARAIVRVEQGADAVCNIPAPTTALEAKFSLRLMTALALAGVDTSDLAAFSDAMTRDPALCALRDKVTVELVAGWPMMQTEVVVELADGGQLRAQHDAGIPERADAEQGRRLDAKFERLAGPVLGSDRMRALAQLLARLESVSAAELMAACASPGDA